MVQKEYLGNDGNTKRVFHSFIDYHHMERWYLSLPESERHIHEVIPSGNQKFKLDLESPSDSIEKKQWDINVCSLIDIVCSLTKTRKHIRFESVDSENKKLSEHIVFNGFFLRDYVDANFFINDIMKVVDSIFEYDRDKMEINANHIQNAVKQCQWRE